LPLPLPLIWDENKKEHSSRIEGNLDLTTLPLNGVARRLKLYIFSLAIILFRYQRYDEKVEV
jgi:hypothetical protein